MTPQHIGVLVQRVPIPSLLPKQNSKESSRNSPKDILQLVMFRLEKQVAFVAELERMSAICAQKYDRGRRSA